MKDKILNVIIIVLLVIISIVITVLVMTNLNKKENIESVNNQVPETYLEQSAEVEELDEKPEMQDNEEPGVIDNDDDWDGSIGEFNSTTDNPEEEWKDGTPETPYLNTMYQNRAYGRLEEFYELVECEVPYTEESDVIITTDDDYTGEILEYVQSASVMAAIEEASKSWPECGKYRLFSVSQFHDNTYRLYRFVFQDGTVQDILEYKDCSIFNWRAKDSLKRYIDSGDVDNMKNVYK